MPVRANVFTKTLSMGIPQVAEAVFALKEGIRASGDVCELVDDGYQGCDVAITASGPKGATGSPARSWQISKDREALLECHPEGRLILESACFRRGWDRSMHDRYWRLSWDGFMRDDGTYFEPEQDAGGRLLDILAEQNIELRPHRDDGRHVLICGQKPSDASLRGLDAHDWVMRSARLVRMATDRPILIRPHPLDQRTALRDRLNDAKLTNYHLSDPKHFSLEQDLRDAWVCVSCTSLSAIEAICDGVPCVTTDPGSLAWDVSSHDLACVNDPHFPTDDEREQWLRRLSWYQWRLSELRSGRAWRSMKKARKGLYL